MTDRSTVRRPDQVRSVLVSSAPARPPIVLEDPPAAPSPALACQERLPRDVLVRLAALSHQVGDIRQEHAQQPELARRLDVVSADLAALIQNIYDETVRHLAGRRG